MKALMKTRNIWHGSAARKNAFAVAIHFQMIKHDKDYNLAQLDEQRQKTSNLETNR